MSHFVNGPSPHRVGAFGTAGFPINSLAHKEHEEVTSEGTRNRAIPPDATGKSCLESLQPQGIQNIWCLADAQKSQLQGRFFASFSRLYYLNHIPPLAKLIFILKFSTLIPGIQNPATFFYPCYFFPGILLDDKSQSIILILLHRFLSTCYSPRNKISALSNAFPSIFSLVNSP